MEKQLVLPKLTITRMQVSKKEQMVQRRSRRRTCCMTDLFPMTSPPLKLREPRQTCSSPCMNNKNTNNDQHHHQHQHQHQHSDSDDHDYTYRGKVPSSDDSGLSSVSSIEEDGEEEELILADILDDKNRIPKKRSNSAPTLVWIDSFQDQAMRLMRKRHSKLQKHRQRAHSAQRSEEHSEVFEPFSPTSPNTLFVPSPTSPDIMFAVSRNSNGDLSVDRLVPDSNNNVSDHSALIENANETVILTDSNGISMFTTTKELVRSFELKRQMRRRRINKKTISFDETILRR